MIFLRKLIFWALWLSPTLSLLAQINTPNNPTVPFGSNTSYAGSVMFPTNLPSGGTDGTSQDAADAYNQWKTDYVEACGTGKYRVKYDTPTETVSEGIAYGMLLAAYAADKDLFDGLWQYYKDNMNGNGVMNWKINGCSGTLGSGGAADAEVDAAMALLVANHQWPNTTTPHNYVTDVTQLINDIKTYEIQPVTANGSYQLNNGDQWGFGNNCRNPSYQSPAYYKQYGIFMNDVSFWDNCVNASYTLLNNNVNISTGLVSNWSDHNGVANSCNGPNEYGWDACRNPWRMATDVAWYDDTNAKNICNGMASHVQSVGASAVGGPIPQTGGSGGYHSPTFVSTYALGVMGANASYQSLLDQMYTETVNTMDSPPWYFGNTLRCISLFMMTGNFWNPLDTNAGPTPPSIDITSPTNGASYIIGNNINLEAIITDNDGTVSTVTFTINGTPTTYTSNNDTYTASWNPPSTGTYVFEVTATDNDNQTSTTSITFDIINEPPPTPPTITISAPTDGVTVVEGNSITLQALAEDSDGTITGVSFQIGGQTLIATNTFGNYWEATWTATTEGTYTLVTTATDDDGMTANDNINIHVIPPNVSAVDVNFSVNDEWNNGYCASIIITNIGSVNIEGWLLEWSQIEGIYDHWNFTLTQNGNDYTAANIEWNGTISPGQNITVGYCASFNGSYTLPEQGIFNGQNITFSNAISSSDIYVDHTAAGNNDGSSWVDAYTDLQDALAEGADKTIHMAKGTYTPTISTTRGISFDFSSNVNLLGGYPNGGGTRAPENNATILSGEIDNISGFDGNSYHVVKLQNVNNVLLDGITIKHGNANDPNTFGRARGGGIYCVGSTLTLENVKVKWNKAIYGAGIFATLSPEVNINASYFQNNTADYGSALYHSNETNLYIRSTTVTNNTALVRCSMEANNSLYTYIENSIFAHNASALSNGLSFIATTRNQSADIYNTTVIGETKDKYLLTIQVGFGDQFDINIYNSIFAHQTASFQKQFLAHNNNILNLNTHHCYIQGSSAIGTHTQPLFEDLVGDIMLNAGFSLNECSPAVNAGNNSYASSLPTDILGNNRIFDVVDLGAFESQTACTGKRLNTDLEKNSILDIYPNPTTHIIYVKNPLLNMEYSIIDVLGNELLRTSSPIIDLEKFNSGIYFLVGYMNGDKIEVRKIMKR